MVLAIHAHHPSRAPGAPRGAKTFAVAIAITLHGLLVLWLLLNRSTVPFDEAPAMTLVEMRSPAAKVSPAQLSVPGSATHRKAALRFADAIAPQPNLRPPRPEGQELAERVDPDRAAGAAVASGVSGLAGDGVGLGAPSGASRKTAHFHPPSVVRRVAAAYPIDAYDSHREGETEVLVTIAPDGALLNASLSKSSGSASLDQATLDAVKRYKFHPADKDGAPIEAQAYVTLAWRITPGMHFEASYILPGDTREHDVEATKEWLNVQARGANGNH
jgi:TonB family protein